MEFASKKKETDIFCYYFLLSPIARLHMRHKKTCRDFFFLWRQLALVELKEILSIEDFHLHNHKCVQLCSNQAKYSMSF